MAIRTREEILASVQARLGDDNSDEALSLVEDITDTLADFETRTQDTTNWRQKYEENDNKWRKKYRDRFFSGSTADDEEPIEEPDRPTHKTYESLFKEG